MLDLGLGANCLFTNYFLYCRSCCHCFSVRKVGTSSARLATIDATKVDTRSSWIRMVLPYVN